MGQIYLDYNSTTPVDPQVLEKMIPFFNKHHGNASSVTHEIGKEAKKSFQNAKSIIARGLNCTPDEIIITSGATESLNLAIKGLVYSSGSSNKHILTLKTEHKAVIDTCDYVQRMGVAVDYLDVDKEGFVDLNQLKAAINENTILVAILHGNNEIGTINPIEKTCIPTISKSIPRKSKGLFVSGRP